MTPSSLLLVALGGALGSSARALVGWLLPARAFPWATLTVNVLGGLAIGWILTRFEARSPTAVFLASGVCGGFTTFSAFSWQLFEQVQRGEVLKALAYALLSVALCLAAVVAGAHAART